MFSAGVSNIDTIGTFNAVIKSAALVTSRSSGKPQIAYQLEITAGDKKGVKINKYDSLATEKSIPMTLGQLRSLGIDSKKIKSPADLPAVLVDLEGAHVRIQCKQNDQFYNIYFQGMAKSSGGIATEESPF